MNIENPNNHHMSIHSEMNVMNKYKKYLRYAYKNKNQKLYYSEINLINIRLSANGTFGPSRPCFHCINSLITCGVKIKYIYYTDTVVVNDKPTAIVRKELLANMLYARPIHISCGNRHKMRMRQAQQASKKSGSHS